MRLAWFLKDFLYEFFGISSTVYVVLLVKLLIVVAISFHMLFLRTWINKSFFGAIFFFSIILHIVSRSQKISNFF